MKSILAKIEFWIFLFLLIRLIGIFNPPLEIGHNWCQVTGLMVARNYLEVDPNILYPRVDDCGETSGVIGMEFPVLNYAHFLMAKIFGFQHWYGRLINLIVSSFGLLFFFRTLLVIKLDRRHAFISTILLAVSIWFSFSRKMMPDTFCISLMMIALFNGIRYLKDPKLLNLVLYTLFSSLAILSKIPAGIYFILFLPLILSKKIGFEPKLYLSLCSMIPLSLTYLWYFVWNPHLAKEFGVWYNIGKSFSAGLNEISSNISLALDNFYFDAFSGFIIFTFFLAGLIMIFLKRNKTLIYIFALSFFIFLVYIFKSGVYFYHHNYYIIPFVPIMAIVAAYSLSFIKTKWVYLGLLVIGCAESIANQQHDFFVKDSELYKLELEGLLDEVSSVDDKIILSGDENPQLMYLSHRKGWIIRPELINDIGYINDLRNKGAGFIILDKHNNEMISSASYEVITETDDFVIYQLR